jgi:hypothetical protein
MAKLSITTAWNETADILRRDFGALFTIALALNALPQILFQALGPGQAAPGQPPQPGLWMLLLPVVIILGFAGTIAISSLALGRDRVVGSAIAHGFRRFLPLFVASLLLGLALGLLFGILAVASGLRPDTFSADPVRAMAKFGLALIVLLPIAFFFGVRLLMMTPVAAAETGGPIAVITRSWALTRGHFWKLLGFILLVCIVFIVVMMVVGAVFGILVALLAGRPEPGNLSSLIILIVSGIVNAAMIAVLTSLIARIYVQLAGDPASTAAVFD